MKIRRPYFAADDGDGGGGKPGDDDQSGSDENQNDDGNGDGAETLTAEAVEVMIAKSVKSATDKLAAAHKKELKARDQKINDLQNAGKTAEELAEAKDKELAERERAVNQGELKLKAIKALAAEGLSVDWADRVVFADEESIPTVVADIKKQMADNVKTQVTEALKKAGIAPKGGDGGDGKTPKKTQKNPFKKGDDFNLTEQMRIAKEDPKLAAELQKLAAE